MANTDLKEVSIRCLRALEPYELFLTKVDGQPAPEPRTYTLTEKEVEKTMTRTMCNEAHEMYKYSKAVPIGKFMREGLDINC